MTARQAQVALWFVLTLVGCEDRLGPSRTAAPRFAEDDGSRQPVVVNPTARGNGVAASIQEGIDMVADGGRVLVTPGTYDERITIDKGLTLESIGGGEGAVIIEQVQATP